MKKEDPAAAKAAIAEALEKALAEKKEGDKTFGDVLKAGMLRVPLRKAVVVAWRVIRLTL
ncbi:MAG: hypothetical protein R3C99_00210 [Pirellulaceae bacterium]